MPNLDVAKTCRPSTGGTPPFPDDVVAIFHDHDMLNELCGQLEAVADSLPRPDRVACARVSRMLDGFFPAHLKRENETLARHLRDEELRGRIIAQHNEDMGLSQELVIALEPATRGERVEDAEALGYMLRCFFNGCRRSMLIEEMALRAALTPRPVLRAV